MPIPDLPLFKHRDTVVTPADQNQFVTQFENTMDTLSNGVIPAINLSINNMNTQYNDIYNNLPFVKLKDNLYYFTGFTCLFVHYGIGFYLEMTESVWGIETEA